MLVLVFVRPACRPGGPEPRAAVTAGSRPAGRHRHRRRHGARRPAERRFPGATVALTHVATDVATTVVTNERGQYRTPPLRIGGYDVSVELAGLQALRPARRRAQHRRRPQRRRGAEGRRRSPSTVTVRPTPPLLNTSDSTVGTVITNQQIEALPLNGRDYLQLASLSAGTGPQAPARASVIGGQAGTPGRVPARRAGQQQPADLDRPLRAEGGRQAVGRRHPGVQGRHQRLRGRVRPVVVGRRQRLAQVGHQRAARLGVRVLPRRRASTRRTTSPRRKPPYNRHQFGGAARRSDRAQPHVLLRRRRTRRHPPARPRRSRRCRPSRRVRASSRAPSSIR